MGHSLKAVPVSASQSGVSFPVSLGARPAADLLAMLLVGVVQSQDHG